MALRSSIRLSRLLSIISLKLSWRSSTL